MSGYLDTAAPPHRSAAALLTPVLITASGTAVLLGIVIYALLSGMAAIVGIVAGSLAIVGLVLTTFQLAHLRRYTRGKDTQVRSPKRWLIRRHRSGRARKGPHLYGPNAQPAMPPIGQPHRGDGATVGGVAFPANGRRPDAPAQRTPPGVSGGATPNHEWAAERTRRRGTAASTAERRGEALPPGANPPADERSTQVIVRTRSDHTDNEHREMAQKTVPISQRSDVSPSAEPQVFDSGSSAGRAQWHLPKGFAPAGLTADGLRLGDVDVRAASVVGPGHRCQEPALARQDAYLLRRSDDGQHLIVAVADGVGQSSHSDLGARVAVSAAARGSADIVDRGGEPHQIDPVHLFRSVAGEMIGTAQKQSLPPSEVYSILVVAVIPTRPGPDGIRTMWTAQIGDVSVWVLRSGSLQQRTGPQKAGLDKNTLTHVLPVDADAVRCTPIELLPGDVVALMTDGLSESLVNIPAAQEFFHRRWAAGPQHPAGFLTDLCYDAPGQSDDRTAVVAWIGSNDEDRAHR